MSYHQVPEKAAEAEATWPIRAATIISLKAFAIISLFLGDFGNNKCQPIWSTTLACIELNYSERLGRITRDMFILFIKENVMM